MTNRRTFIAGAGSVTLLTLSGCVGVSRTESIDIGEKNATGRSNRSAYRAMPNERFPIPAVDLKKVPPRFRRQEVSFKTKHPQGTIIVDTKSFYLHLVQGDGTAMRYGVGLGRQGFDWSGRGVIQWKRKWPTWTPPDEMIARRPELERWSIRNGGMPAGIDNPLGARALYIFQGGRDTLYRIHGTPEYWTIGKAVSSGCVRLINQDVIDLYDRVGHRATLIVT